MVIGLRNDGRVSMAYAVPGKRWSMLLILALAACGVCLAGSSQISNAPPLLSRSLGHVGWAVADFDGDSQPDVAITKAEARGSGYVYRLEFDLSTRRDRGLSQSQPDLPAITSSLFGLHLTPRDVDGDRDLDVVVTMGIARQPVAVWINDGQGRFEEADPAAFSAWIWLENISLSTQDRPETSQMTWDLGRRSPALPAGGRPVESPRRSGAPPIRSREPWVSRLPADQRPARAPPSYLSVPC